MKYTVKVPFINDMGSISPFVAIDTPMESALKNALWTINSMRNHDGLAHLKRLPTGTKFKRIEE